jgi:hypothetical protein
LQIEESVTASPSSLLSFFWLRKIYSFDTLLKRKPKRQRVPMNIIDGNELKFFIEPFRIIVLGIYCAAYAPNASPPFLTTNIDPHCPVQLGCGV